MEIKNGEGRVYKIGARKIRMCEREKCEKKEIKEIASSQKDEKTVGTIMSKYKNLEKIIR
jgi:hypothetical protein